MKYSGPWTIDGAPEVGTLAVMRSAAEAHYRISVLEWAARERAAGRPPGDDLQPPPALRRQFWAAAYDHLLRDVQCLSHSGYSKALEVFRAEALAGVK